jgi:hypothetical protein
MNDGKLGPQSNEALQVLALRLPEVLGGSPIAPGDLLKPRMGGSAPGGGGGIMETLQRLFGNVGAPQAGPAPLSTGPQASAGGSMNVANFAPGNPSITPGGEQQQAFVPPPSPPMSGGPAGSMPMPSQQQNLQQGGTDALTAMLRSFGPMFRNG